MHKKIGENISVIVCSVMLLAPNFAFALTPNDRFLSEQWYLETIDAYGAWDITTGSRDVVVAVLDTGIDPDHEDITPNLWVNTGEIPGDGIDNDKNGYIDDYYGWDFVDDDNTPMPNKDKGFNEDAVMHATLIAGAIGAVGNNRIGIAGLNWEVEIMNVRILDNFGSGSSGDARRAIRYAVDNGANVINLSFTGFDLDPSFLDAVQYAFNHNVTFVAAMGNSEDGGVDTDETPIYPACFVGDSGEDLVIGVAATDQNDARAFFSNYGKNCTDLSAPGEGIFGTVYEDSAWESFTEKYLGGWNGTSIAVPFVAGTVALLKGSFPTLTPTDISTILQLSVDPANTGSDGAGTLGAGRLNVARALSVAGDFAEQPDDDGMVEAPSDEETGVFRDSQGRRTAPNSGKIGLSPLTGNAEMISEIHAGWFIRSPGFDTVYYVDENLQRRPFWNGQTYFTWADSWDDIVWVTDATMPSMSLGKPLTPKPGVVLVKIQSDPNVYAVEGDVSHPILRHVVSEAIAEGVYGLQWASFVLDVDPAIMGRYGVGRDLDSLEPIDVSQMKTREEIAALLEG